MAQKYTMFLADGTPLRATCSVKFKLGLPPTLAPNVLAAKSATTTAASAHPGGAHFAFLDGSVRFFSGPRTSLEQEFLLNTAGRQPIEQVSHGGAGALFINPGELDAAERKRFLSAMNGIAASRSPAKTIAIVQGHVQAGDPRCGPAAIVAGMVMSQASRGGIRTGSVMQWKLTSAFPLKVVGPSLNANGGNDVAMEEITLAYENIDLV